MSVKHFIPSIVWVLLIFAAIGMPPEPIKQLGIWEIPHLDKIVHTVLFFVFAVLNSYGASRQNFPGTAPWYIYLTVFALGIIIGGTTELYQLYFVPGRTASISDMLFNIFGTIFGVFVWVLYLRINGKNIFG